MNSDVIVPITLPAMVILFTWIVFSTIRRWKIAKAQAEVHAKVLEKFGSSADLVTFINSEAGKRFLESATIEQRPREPFARILMSVQAGIVLALVGLGCFLVRHVIPDSEQGFVIFGTLALTLGVGFLISAGASYRLSKSFGLLEDARAARD